jgi:endonuclease G
MSDDYNKMLLERARQSLKGTTLKKVLNRVRAIVGDQKTIEQEEMAKEAMELLAEGTIPAPALLAALELSVRLMRPAPMAKGGTFQNLNEESAGAFEHWSSFQEAVKPFIHSIGRIDRLSLGGGSDAVIGTGFLVTDELLVTNRHVLDELSRGTRVLEKGQAIVHFQREFFTADDEDEVDILNVEAVHPTLDIALLKIAKMSLSAARQPLRFAEATVGERAPIVAIGFPCEDTRNPIFIDAIFNGHYKVKRSAPGLVTGFGSQAFYHDCSTLGGNSGSPLLSMETAEIVGLHREGRFMYRNEAVNLDGLKDFVQAHST